MNEPLLEMTEWEKQWFRHIFDYPSETDYLPVAHELYDALLRVEAGRRRAEWEVGACRQGQDCSKLPQGDWTPADWLAKVEREVKGE